MDDDAVERQAVLLFEEIDEFIYGGKTIVSSEFLGFRLIQKESDSANPSRADLTVCIYGYRLDFRAIFCAEALSRFGSQSGVKIEGITGFDGPLPVLANGLPLLTGADFFDKLRFEIQRWHETCLFLFKRLGPRWVARWRRDYIFDEHH